MGGKKLVFDLFYRVFALMQCENVDLSLCFIVCSCFRSFRFCVCVNISLVLYMVSIALALMECENVDLSLCFIVFSCC